MNDREREQKKRERKVDTNEKRCAEAAEQSQIGFKSGSYRVGTWLGVGRQWAPNCGGRPRRRIFLPSTSFSAFFHPKMSRFSMATHKNVTFYDNNNNNNKEMVFVDFFQIDFQ